MDKPYVIGMDMGGTNTVFGIVDARGTVISKSAIKTSTHTDVNLYINDIYTELSKLIEAAGGVPLRKQRLRRFRAHPQSDQHQRHRRPRQGL